MAKYHFNKETGKTGQCTAKVKCRLGLAESEHFSTREEAQLAYEKTNDTATFATLEKESIKNESAQKSIKQGFANIKELKLEGVNFNFSDLSDDDAERLVKNWNKRYKILSDIDKGLIDKPEYFAPTDFLAESVDEIRGRGVYFQSIQELIDENNPYVSVDSLDKDSEYIAVVSARQGGGNRECYCDSYDGHEDGCLAANNDMITEHPNYVTDYDDDFDSTYNYFIFDNKIKKEQVDEYQSSRNDYYEYKKLEAEQKLVKEGQAPAWFINNIDEYNNSLSEYKTSKRKYNESLERLKDDKEQSEKAERIVEKFENRDFENISLEELQTFNTFRKRYTKYDLDMVKGAARKVKEYEDAQKVYEQAESLDDGSELKEYLLGDRGTGSYNTTEKRGRSKVTVTKTFQRGSLLGKELESKKSSSEYAEKDLSNFIEPFKDTANSYRDIFNSVAGYRKSSEVARRKTWESGWVYDSPVPKMPKDFLRD